VPAMATVTWLKEGGPAFRGQVFAVDMDCGRSLPRRIWFNAVFAPEPQVRMERREQLDAIPPWDNPRDLPLSSTTSDSITLARKGLCYLGPMMPWDSLIVFYTLPSDPDGVGGPPCAVPLVLTRGRVTRLREVLELPITQLASPTIPPLQIYSAFVSYLSVPLGTLRHRGHG
jgi:hypothetical protein